MDRLRLRSSGFLTHPNFCLCVRDVWHHVRHVTHSRQAQPPPPAPRPRTTTLKKMFCNHLVFLYLFLVGDGPFVPVASPRRHLTHPRHAATAFTSSSQRSRGQRPCCGSGMAGWRVLLTSGLLMCGLVYVNWDEAL